MRDILALYIEASIAKGEWKAALSALQPLCAGGNISTSAGFASAAEAASSIFHLTSTLSSNNEWRAALAVLRSAPPPPSVRGRVQYSPGYLAARVRAYHHLLQARCRHKMEEVAGGAAAVASAIPSVADVPVGTEEMSFESALGLAREAFALDDGASTLCDRSRTPYEEKSKETAEGAHASSLAAHSADPGMEADSVEALLRWCRMELPLRRSLTGVATGKQAETAMEELTELAAAALRGVSNVLIDVPHTASNDLRRKNPSDAQRAEVELLNLLRRNSRATDAWETCLGLLQRIPVERVSGHLFTALLRHLLHCHRKNEADQLVRTLLLLRMPDDSAQQTLPELTRTPPSCASATALRTDSAVLKVVSEACYSVRRTDLAAALLLDTEARASMTPSVAVPLVMTLRDAGAFSPVLLWWELLRKENSALHYPLLRHAKLSSYVASCVLRSTSVRSSESTPKLLPEAPSPAKKNTKVDYASLRTGDWHQALDVFRDAVAPAHDPALVLLFKLRLLRQAGQWRAALQIFYAFCQAHPNLRNTDLPPSASVDQKRDSRRHNRPGWRPRPEVPDANPGRGRGSAMKSACAVMTHEQAEQWIPRHVLDHLRRQVESLTPCTVRCNGESAGTSSCVITPGGKN